MGLSNAGAMFRPLQTEARSCDQHGEYTASLFKIPGLDAEQWTSCPICMQTRISEEDRRHTAEVIERRRRLKIETELGRAAIPERFLDRTLENYRAEHDGQARALRVAKDYADNWPEKRDAGTCLIMCGNPGNGKTHLAVGIARVVMDQGDMAMYAVVRDIDRMIKETWGRGGPRTERQVLADLAAPDLLIVDEVGHQRGTDDERMHLFDVINARYERGRPTILITNLGLDQLRGANGHPGYLDPRAEDRLREGGGRVIVFDWESYRKG